MKLVGEIFRDIIRVNSEKVGNYVKVLLGQNFMNHKAKGMCDEPGKVFMAMGVIEFDGPFTVVQRGAGDGPEAV